MQRHLQVVAAAGLRTLAAQRETAGVVGIDQFMVDRRCIRQQAQPAEGVYPFVLFEHTLGNALPGNPMEAVTASNVIAIQALDLTVFFKGQVGLLALELMRLNIAGRIEDGGPVGCTGLHQVTGNFGLAIDHHRLAAGQGLEIQALAAPANQQLDTFVHQAFAVHTFGHTGLAQQVDRALLQHTGADAAQHVLGGLALDDHRVDTGVMQQLTQQQARRARANDCNLSFHCCCLCWNDTGPALAVARHLLLGFAFAFLRAKPATELCYSMQNLHFYKKRSINGQAKADEIHPTRRSAVQVVWGKPGLAWYRPAAL